MNELWAVVKTMGAFKAPRPDGFQALFYHSQWDVGGHSLLHLVHKVLSKPDCVKDINDTIIALIPKVDDVVCVK